MPFLDITPSEVDVQLGRALSGVSQDLLKDGGGATGLNPECPHGVAEEVGGDLDSCLLTYSLKNLLDCS